MQELRHAVAVEPGDTLFDEEGLPDGGLVESTSTCEGFLTIQGNDTVSLVHDTAQEYLECHSTALFPGTHSVILQTCLTYLSLDDFQQGPCVDDESFVKRCEQYPLMRYTL